VISLSVRLSTCLLICLSACISPEPHIQTSPNFLSLLPMAVARFFSDGVNCDKLCTSGFVEFPILGPMAQEIQVRRKLKVTYQGQHGFDTAAYAQPNSPGGSIRPGRSLVSTIVSLVDIKQQGPAVHAIML